MGGDELSASTEKLPRPSPWNMFIKDETVEVAEKSQSGFELRAFAHDAGLAEDSKFSRTGLVSPTPRRCWRTSFLGRRLGTTSRTRLLRRLWQRRVPLPSGLGQWTLVFMRIPSSFLIGLGSSRRRRPSTLTAWALPPPTRPGSTSSECEACARFISSWPLVLLLLYPATELAEQELLHSH